MRNFVLWLFLNNCNVFWLLKEMTTTCSDFVKILQSTKEVAYQLIDIFCMFSAPFVLQSDNGREFANKIIQNLADMWPGMKLVRGKPRHSQSQGSNQDVWDMLVAWMSDNNTKAWSEGLRFIQSKKNRALHSGIKTTPYEAMFGAAQRIGLGDSPLTEDMYSSIETDEEMEQLFNAGMNNGWDKDEANQQDRKGEDENQTNDTSKETVEKKDNKKVTVWFVRSHQALTSVQCVTSLFILFVEVMVKTVRVSDWESLATSV